MTRYKGRTSAKTIEREGNHDGRHDRQHVCDQKSYGSPSHFLCRRFCAGRSLRTAFRYPRTLLFRVSTYFAFEKEFAPTL
jgi:hypothetical protein